MEYKCKNNYMAFYEMGILYNKIGELINEVEKITK